MDRPFVPVDSMTCAGLAFVEKLGASGLSSA